MRNQRGWMQINNRINKSQIYIHIKLLLETQSIEFHRLIAFKWKMNVSWTTIRFISCWKCWKLPKIRERKKKTHSKTDFYLLVLDRFRCGDPQSHDTGAWNGIHQLQYHQVVDFFFVNCSHTKNNERKKECERVKEWNVFKSIFIFFFVFSWINVDDEKCAHWNSAMRG